jgi:group I intron endonuclease
MMTFPKGAGVYEIRNTVCGRRYLGSSSMLRRRIDAHKYELRHGKHPNVRLQRAWNRDGEAAFQFTLLARLETDEALPTEQRMLDQARASGEVIYNFAPHADAPMRGRKASPESRALMSEAQRQRYRDPKEREAQSDRMRQFLADPAERVRWSSLRRADNAKPDVIARKAAACKASWTPERRARDGASRRGRKVSDVGCQNMREAQQRRFLDSAARQQRSDAAKARWADPVQREKLVAAIRAGSARASLSV